MRYLPLPVILFVVFFLAVLLLLPSQPFNDPGAFWHVRVGEWIVQHGAFPTTDPFTFTFADKEWRPQQWGAEILLYGLHSIGGFDALLTGMAAVLGGMGAGIGTRFLRSGLHPFLAVLLVGFGFAVAAFHFYARPHLATMVLSAVYAGLMVDTEREGIIKPARWLLLLPLCILWTNLHGGVVGGIGTLVLAVGGWTLWKMIGKSSPIRSGRDIGFLCLVLLGCGLATLVNPFGFKMHRIWFSLIDSPVLKQIVSEHMPLNLQRTDGQAVAAFGLFYIVMLLGTLPKWPRVSWLVPLAWLLQSFMSIRHGPIFCVVGLVAMADFFPETCWYRWLKKNGDTLIGEPRPATPCYRCLAVPVALVICCLGLQAAQVPVPFVGFGSAKFDPKGIPLEMIEPLQAYAKDQPPGTPIFNDANLGGFVLWFAPNLKTFMDDRCELFGEDWLKHYSEVVFEKPEGFDAWAAKYPFQRALVVADPDGKSGSKLDDYLKSKPGEWREVIRCKTAAMYERVR